MTFEQKSDGYRAFLRRIPDHLIDAFDRAMDCDIRSLRSEYVMLIEEGELRDMWNARLLMCVYACFTMAFLAPALSVIANAPMYVTHSLGLIFAIFLCLCFTMLQRSIRKSKSITSRTNEIDGYFEVLRGFIMILVGDQKPDRDDEHLVHLCPRAIYERLIGAYSQGDRNRFNELLSTVRKLGLVDPMSRQPYREQVIIDAARARCAGMSPCPVKATF